MGKTEECIEKLGTPTGGGPKLREVVECMARFLEEDLKRASDDMAVIRKYLEEYGYKLD